MPDHSMVRAWRRMEPATFHWLMVRLASGHEPSSRVVARAAALGRPTATGNMQSGALLQQAQLCGRHGHRQCRTCEGMQRAQSQHTRDGCSKFVP